MQFQPGQSGNPAGRPPGALNKKTLAARGVLEERAEEIITNLVDRAMEGHGTAMRLCFDRLVPKGLDRPVAIELPVVKTPEDAELALTMVLDECRRQTDDRRSLGPDYGDRPHAPSGRTDVEVPAGAPRGRRRPGGPASGCPGAADSREARRAPVFSC
jgi:Family of unknown function (DUF5681)